MGVDVRMGLISWLQLQRGVGNWPNGAKNARSRRELNRGPLSVLSNLLTGWQGFWTPLQQINLGPPHVVRKLLLKKKRNYSKRCIAMCRKTQCTGHLQTTRTLLHAFVNLLRCTVLDRTGFYCPLSTYCCRAIGEALKFQAQFGQTSSAT